jgi:Flp pilus assembly protein TadG
MIGRFMAAARGHGRRSRMPGRPRPDSGQALVEFALVVPLLILLLVGIFEFARAWNAYQVITDAAREAMRRVVVEDTLSQAGFDQTISSALNRAGLSTTGATITVSDCKQTWCTNGSQAAGTIAQVTVSYPYGFVVLGKLMGLPSVTLHSTFRMRNE